MTKMALGTRVGEFVSQLSVGGMVWGRAHKFVNW